MDLDTYALAYDAGSKASGPESAQQRGDVKGKSRATDGDGDGKDSGDGLNPSSNDEPTLASDMQQLTNSLGSWWSGFSKQSVQTFNQAQTKLQEASKNVNEQGGIVEFAKREAKRIEKELEEKRREAKERVQRQEEEEKAARAQALAQQEEEQRKDGGVRRGSSDEAIRATTARGASLDGVEEEGEELFDADATAPAASASASASGATSDKGTQPTTATSTSSLFDRLQSLSSDPRVASLQKDVSSRINSLNLFGSGGSAATAATTTTTQRGTHGGDAGADTLPTIFSDLSKSLSKLSSPETKELARKYMKASEEVVGKVGEEWKDFLGELVRVVPPEGEGKAEEGQQQVSEKGKQKSESEGGGQQRADVPTETSVTDDKPSSIEAAAGSDTASVKAAPAQASSPATAAATTTAATPTPSPATASQEPPTVETTSKPAHGAEGDESVDDSDSDWE